MWQLLFKTVNRFSQVTFKAGLQPKVEGKCWSTRMKSWTLYFLLHSKTRMTFALLVILLPSHTYSLTLQLCACLFATRRRANSECGITLQSAPESRLGFTLVSVIWNETCQSSWRGLPPLDSIEQVNRWISVAVNVFWFSHGFRVKIQPSLILRHRRVKMIFLLIIRTRFAESGSRTDLFDEKNHKNGLTF